MSIFDTMKGWFSTPGNVTEKQEQQYSQSVMEAFGVSGSSSGIPVTPESAMRVSAVYACVEKLSGGVSTLPINIYKTDGMDRKLLPKDMIWYLLNEEPAEQYTAASSWEKVVIDNSLRGDSFALIRRKLDGSIKELFPLPWTTVLLRRMPGGKIRYYVFYPEYDIKTWFDSSEILHFPGLGFDGIRSMSVIKYAARNATGNAISMDEYSGKFFQNGAHPSIILQYPNKVSNDQVNQLQESFARKYSGLDNYHKIPLVLSEGGTAKEISLSAEDAQLLEARKFQVVDIARAFGVPPHMIGETSASTTWGSGIEAINRGFFTYTLQMRLVRIEQELNRKIFRQEPQYRIEFDRDALLEGDSAAQSTYYRAALGGPGTGIGWMTVDEIRKRKNLSPFGGVAAEIYDPRQTPLNESQNNANDKTVTGQPEKPEIASEQAES